MASAQHKFPFTVYTATRGYAWSSLPDGFEREDLDAFYRQAAALKPDFMTVGDEVRGVFAQGGIIAAFRLGIAPKWDDFGRDADYCAFTFILAEMARDVDFASLLALPAFSTPTRHPPHSIVYDGPEAFAADKATLRHLFDRGVVPAFDFRTIGDALGVLEGRVDWARFTSVVSMGETTTGAMRGSCLVASLAAPRRPPAYSWAGRRSLAGKSSLGCIDLGSFSPGGPSGKGRRLRLRASSATANLNAAEPSRGCPWYVWAVLLAIVVIVVLVAIVCT